MAGGRTGRRITPNKPLLWRRFREQRRRIDRLGEELRTGRKGPGQRTTRDHDDPYISALLPGEVRQIHAIHLPDQIDVGDHEGRVFRL